MSNGVNKAILLGHVGKDPEIRSTNGGTIVASFSLATADRQKDGQGNWQDRTEWHNLCSFRRQRRSRSPLCEEELAAFDRGPATARICS
jgi:single stranded DNA-binding protein